MATKRIKDITGSTTTPASDDYVALDGVTNGTRKITADNLLIAAGDTYLEEANNLSDVASAATSRTNLDVYSTTEVDDQTYTPAAVNDRTNSRQPSNGVYFDGTAKLDCAKAGATDLTTESFTISTLVRVPDTVSTTNTLAATRTLAEGFQQFLRASGAYGTQITDVSANAASTADDGEDVRGRTVLLTSVIDRAADTLTRYIDGAVSTGAVLDTSAVTGDLSDIGTGGFHVGHRNSDFYLDGGEIFSSVLITRALSAAEVLTLYKRGNIPEIADQWGGVEITSGSLEVGQRYRITNFQAGDDFTNVGAGSNANDVEFVATGTTPTTWTNSSGITPIGAVVALLPENIESDGSIVDASSNELNAVGTNTSALLVKVTESGTFTPSLLLGGSSAGQVYNTTNTFGNFKVVNDGAHCHVWGRIQFNGGAGDKGSGIGAAVMAGLPKNAAASAADAIPVLLTINNASGLTSLTCGIIAQGSTQITLHDNGAAGLVALQETNLLDTSIVRFNFVYPI